MIDLLSLSVGIIACFLVFIILGPLFMKMDNVEQYSRIIYNLGLGCGAFMGGLVGLKYVDDYLKQKKLRD